MRKATAATTKKEGSVPLLDEVEEIGNKIMAKVEKAVEQTLQTNPTWTIARMVRVLHVIGKLTLGTDDIDVTRLDYILTHKQDEFLRQILDHPDEIRRRMAK